MSNTFLTKIPISGRVGQCLQFIHTISLKGKVVIDIGSSFGWLEGQLRSSGAKKIIGIEPNPKAVSFAKENFGNVAEFKVGNALNIPINDETADIAILFDVIEHVPNNTEIKALREINRILKKEGVLLLTTPNSHWFANVLDPAWYFGHRHYSKVQIEKLLINSNFKVSEHVVKGGWISALYMLWFYIGKWIFQQKQPSSLFQKLDDNSYNNPNGFVTHFIKAIKS